MHGSSNCWGLQAVASCCSLHPGYFSTFHFFHRRHRPTECCIAPVITVWVVICVWSPAA